MSNLTHQELQQQVRELQKHIVHSETQRIGLRSPFDNDDSDLSSSAVVIQGFVDRITHLETSLDAGARRYQGLAQDHADLRRQLDELQIRYDALAAQVRQTPSPAVAPPAPPHQQMFGDGSMSLHIYGSAPTPINAQFPIPSPQPALPAIPPNAVATPSSNPPKCPRWRDRCQRELKNLECTRRSCHFVHKDQLEILKDIIPTLPSIKRTTLPIRKK